SSGTAGRSSISFGGLGGGFGGLQSLFGGFGGQTQNSQPAIRTRLRAAINVERPATLVVERAVATRFQQMSRPEFRTVKVQVVEGRGILTGVVASQRDRRMSELLLRLEPGIREIDNQLTVQPAPQ
ncbi:MAG: BON domain-containing protein, partial [Rubripirellula sp.]|nr:BON domain-containing protein [Rubripirellula sp.]